MYCINGTKCLEEKCKRRFFDNHSRLCTFYERLAELLYKDATLIDKCRIAMFLEQLLEDRYRQRPNQEEIEEKIKGDLDGEMY